MKQSGNNLLLVEGQDDLHVVSALLKQHNLTDLRDSNDRSIAPLKLKFSREEEPKNLDIEHVGGIVGVLEKFPSLIISGTYKFDAIGIIIDFDPPNIEQNNNRDVAVRDIISDLNNYNRWNISQDFSILDPFGFIAEPCCATLENIPRIGVWFMPNNHDRGMLETFLEHLIPEPRQELFGFAREVTDNAKNYGAPYRDCDRSKAVIHTFLSWMDKPGKPFGTSFDNQSFDANAELARTFIGWIERLFLS
ncbi:MAG: hypothetical protein LBH59_05785 [Planctomycetaceae bacterium]|jgi:hypothetical protein|nr:hypothetical protein [Planctomycetaceae bacterium]